MAKKATPQDTEKVPEVSGSAILVNAQFIRDLSFEAPKMPEILAEMQTNQPDININVNVNTKQYEDNVFEVAVH